MQFVDAHWATPLCHGIDFDSYKETLKKKLEEDNRYSVQTNFYNNYLMEETLVDLLRCGGFRHQPICIYDFTVKNLSHELLNYSTRHLNEEGKDAFID